MVIREVQFMFFNIVVRYWY